MLIFENPICHIEYKSVTRSNFHHGLCPLPNYRSEVPSWQIGNTIWGSVSKFRHIRFFFSLALQLESFWFSFQQLENFYPRPFRKSASLQPLVGWKQILNGAKCKPTLRSPKFKSNFTDFTVFFILNGQISLHVHR